MSSGNKEKSIAYSHHLAESSSSNFSVEEANYRNKELVHAEQVKLLDKRLRILEDEAEILKLAFLEDVEERRKLVNEIRNEFQAAFGYTKVLLTYFVMLQLKLLVSTVCCLMFFSCTASTTRTPANST